MPYGSAVDRSGVEPFKYTGKHQDTSVLYYFEARYCDPAVGRFTTEDPVRGTLADPQTLNRYVYCRNNPLKYTDPDGRFINLVAATIGGIVGVAIGDVTHLFAHPRDVFGAVVSAGIGGYYIAMVTGDVSR
ncbi:MAG: RHS repeat-associated core domain-containing protein [Candidatus Bathyarchaeota archaeon]|nr:RHS repeat-associated core domain-containing protein [Candidatus Bathyarchaeota archaeon]